MKLKPISLSKHFKRKIPKKVLYTAYVVCPCCDHVLKVGLYPTRKKLCNYPR